MAGLEPATSDREKSAHPSIELHSHVWGFRPVYWKVIHESLFYFLKKFSAFLYFVKKFWGFLFWVCSRKSLYILTFHWPPPTDWDTGSGLRHRNRAADSCLYTFILLLFSSSFLIECTSLLCMGLCTVYSIISVYSDTLLYIHSVFCIIFMNTLHTRKPCKIRKTDTIVGISTFMAIS